MAFTALPIPPIPPFGTLAPPITAPATAPANTSISKSSGQPIAARGDGGDSFDAVSAAASAA